MVKERQPLSLALMGGEPEGRGLVIIKIPKALDGGHRLPSKNDDSEGEVTARAPGA